jgi:lipopolysaccharide transport protein LptA
MGKTRKNPARLIRFLVVVSLLVLLAWIGWNFATHSRKRQKIPVELEHITSQRVEKREKIEHFEIKGAKENFKVRADQHYMGEDDRYHLEGNVEVVIFKRSEETDIFLSAQEIVYDGEWNHFFVSGGARVEFEDIVIQTPSLDYDNKREVFTTDEGAAFTSQTISGSAQRMFYSMAKERLRLNESVFLKIKPRLETSFPFEIEGDRLDYNRKKNKGKMEGHVFLIHGKSQAWAESVEFELYGRAEQMKNMYFKGQVRALIEEEEREEDPSGETALIPQGTKREILADELSLRGFKDVPKVHSWEAKGGCSLKFFSSGEGFSLIEGEKLEFVINRKGRLKSFKATKNTKITEQGETPGEVRIVEGETLVTTKDDILEVKGTKRRRPRIMVKEGEIQADEAYIELEKKDFEVTGDVKMSLQLAKGENENIGFFSKEQPIFITSGRMRFSDEKQRFLFKEGTKMWQGRETLMAGTVGILLGEGKILCSEGVKTVVPYKPKDREEEILEISAEIMEFTPEENLISFEGKASLALKNINLEAQTIEVLLGDEPGDIKEILGHDKAVIVQDRREGRGKEAVYDVAKDSVVLTGNPVLIDKDQGEIRGDKLTFHMGDGRIVVENKDRERSVTVIKS